MMQRLLLFFLLMFAAYNVVAQELMPQRPQRTPEQIAQKQTERLQRDLQLTTEQRDTIYRIHLKYVNLRKEDEMRDSTELRIKNMIEEVLPILTEEQKVAFYQFLKEIGPKRQSTPRMRAAEAEVVGETSAAE